MQCCVSLKEERRNTQRTGHMKTEAGNWVMLPQAKECQSQGMLEESQRMESPLGPPERTFPPHTLIADFSPPEL